MTQIVAGNPAPQFSLQGLDGKQYALPGLLRRGPVIAAFFKVSCPVCQFTFAFLERLHKRYGLTAATFLGISQDDRSATKKFMAEYGVTFQVALDEAPHYPVSNAYGLTNVPAIFLIESDGSITQSGTGFDKRDLETIAAELANRQKIPLEALFAATESVPAHKPG